MDEPNKDTTDQTSNPSTPSITPDPVEPTAPDTVVAPSAAPVTPAPDTSTPPLEATDDAEAKAAEADKADWPKPIVSKTKRSPLKLLLIAVIILALAAGAFYALKQTVLKPKVTVAPVAVIKSIPLLRIGTLEGPIGSDYIFPKAISTGEALSIDYQMFEGLVGYNNGKIAPLLASSWTNPNSKTWVFELAHNVKFQNGTTMQPKDVKTSIESLMKDDYWGQFTSTIDTVTVTGANEVTITTTQPDPLLLNRLVDTFVYTTGTDGITSGTGPYKLDASKPATESSVNLVAFNGYHQGVPKTQALTFTVYDDIDAMNTAAKQSKIDTFDDDGHNAAATKAALTTAGYATKTYELPGSFGLFLNMTRSGGALSNQKVREAVNYALDRQAVVSKVPGESFTPSQRITPKSVVGYSASAVLPGYDLAKSKALQADAGYPAGAPITVGYIPGVQQQMGVIIDQLKAAGFKVTVQTASGNDFFDIIQGGKLDIYGLTEYSVFNDLSDILTDTLDSTGGGPGAGNYKNPQFDAMLSAAQQEFNPTAHLQKLQALNKLVIDNTLWIPVNYSDSVVYARTSYDNIFNYFNPIIQATYYWNVGQQVAPTTTPKSSY